MISFCQPCLGDELWYLEMPSSHGKALLKRFQEKPETDYKVAIEKISDLIKTGTVREIEHLAPNQKPIAPKQEANDEEGKTAYNIGSFYDIRKTSPSSRQFGIRYLRSDDGNDDFSVGTHFEVGRVWTPTFSLNTGETYRLLLERNLDSDREIIPATYTLQVNIQVPELPEQRLVWHLQDITDPTLSALSWEQGGLMSNKFEGGTMSAGYRFEVRSMESQKKDRERLGKVQGAPPELRISGPLFYFEHTSRYPQREHWISVQKAYSSLDSENIGAFSKELTREAQGPNRAGTEIEVLKKPTGGRFSIKLQSILTPIDQ